MFNPSVEISFILGCYIKGLQMNKKVAVIMSVYKSDSLKQFKVAVESVLSQTHPVDLFIIQDGGVENSLSSYMYDLSLEGNVFIHKFNENGGLSKALNYLLDVVLTSDYDFIARMDSDDISMKTRIEEQVNFLCAHCDIDVLGTFCREFGSSFALPEKKLPTSHEELLQFSITRCPFVHPTVMFRRGVFKSGIRYPTNTKFTEDMGLWFKLLENDFRFANLPLSLLWFRLSEDTALRRKGWSKALSETSLRLRYMFILKRFSFKNLFLILSRLVFHIMPVRLVKFAYSHLR